MKNNKGISLITLLVTIIVIIIIVSIVAFNGVNMIDDAKNKDAEDKLRIICSAILKDDDFLKFSGDEEVVLNESDFDYMDLMKYYNEDHIVRIKKIEKQVDTTKNIEYTLFLTDTENSKEYSYTFDYSLHKDKYNYDISFDDSKGVNRPIVVEGMTAIMPDGVTEVEDIFTSNWYSYEKGFAKFAKVKYEDEIYVWIPRFAYDIQNFYEGRKQNDIPASAINITFLRETSSYMKNDEVLEGEYKVHPAFTKDNKQYSGIWIKQEYLAKSSLPSSPLYEEFDDGNVHMMTNMECGAAIYLMGALNAMSEISFEDDEYVAASVDGLGAFSSSNGYVTAYTLNESGDINLGGIYGDAFYETPWNRLEQDYPTETNRYVVRKFTDSLYSFTNSDGTDRAAYRGVITIK